MKLTTANLLALRAGTLSFDKFARLTHADFHHLAWKILISRPKDEFAPVWTNWDDLVQDMLMDVPDAVARWDSSSPMSIKDFVVYRVCTRAKKVIRRARLGKQLERESCPDRSEPYTEALQERVAMVQELVDVLPQTELQRVVLETMVRTQNLAVATRELARDPRTMRTFAVADDIASKKIRRVLVLMADRAAHLQRQRRVRR